jgi:3D domain
VSRANDRVRRSKRGRLLRHTEITEYYPVPERWFVGKRVTAPGLSGRHRIDWLYSARGLAMEGDGMGMDGHSYHVESVGSRGWVDRRGRRARAARGTAFWRNGGYWRSEHGRLTFPLADRGWFAGVGKKYVAPPGIVFGSGPSRALGFYRSVAVDPRLIALGSRIFIPAYRHVQGSNGWFVAQDTGEAIKGRHIDVYRPAPSTAGGGRLLQDQRVYVVPPRPR